MFAANLHLIHFSASLGHSLCRFRWQAVVSCTDPTNLSSLFRFSASVGLRSLAFPTRCFLMQRCRTFNANGRFNLAQRRWLTKQTRQPCCKRDINDYMPETLLGQTTLDTSHMYTCQVDTCSTLNGHVLNSTRALAQLEIDTLLNSKWTLAQI